jgi:gas vesicle protein
MKNTWTNHKEILMDNRDEFGMFAVGILVGALTGAVIALLFAPQSGEETRAQLKEKSLELQQSAEAAAAEARARADELTRQVTEYAENLRSKGAKAPEPESEPAV